MIKPEQEFKILQQHIDQTFQRRPNTIYRLWIVRDRFDQSVNFFMLIQPKLRRPHSIPLHMVLTLDLDIIETIITQIRHQYHLTMIFVGFEGLRWPTSQQLIQSHTVVKP